MKLLPASFLIFIAFFSFRLEAQDITPEVARFEALAGSSAVLTGSWSVYGNQAGLASITRPEVGGSFQNRFLLKELSGRSAFFALPVQSSVFAVSFYQFGEILFRQEQFGVAYANSISPKLSFGVGFNYYRLYLPEDNKYEGSSGIEFGFQYVANTQVLLGVHVLNPYRTGIRKYSGTYFYPTRLNVGINYCPTSLFSLMSELEYDSDKQLILRSGLEYQLINDFFIRAGVSGKPVHFTGGFGFKLNRISLDLASSYHIFLGNSPSISFQYQF